MSSYDAVCAGGSSIRINGGRDINGLKLSTKPYQSAVLAVQDMLHGNLDYVIVDAAPAASITASINGTK